MGSCCWQPEVGDPGPPTLGGRPAVSDQNGAHTQTQRVHTTCWGVKTSHKYLHRGSGTSASGETGLVWPQEVPSVTHTPQAPLKPRHRPRPDMRTGDQLILQSQPGTTVGQAGSPTQPQIGATGPGEAAGKDTVPKKVGSGDPGHTAGRAGGVRGVPQARCLTLFVPGLPSAGRGQTSLPSSHGAQLFPRANTAGQLHADPRCRRWRVGAFISWLKIKANYCLILGSIRNCSSHSPDSVDTATG